MPSPFPGMDPYLERHWGDVHTSLVTYARDHLNKALPRELRARVEEQVFVELPDEPRAIVPDVRIFERAIPGKTPAVAASGVATAEPLIIPLDEPITERYLEIRDASAGHRVITVIEVLSQTNKSAGEGRTKYIQKRKELCEAGVSMVEIDLLRSGKNLLAFPIESLPPESRTPYGVCVTRSWKLTRVEFYPVSLRQPLPTIQIPLRQTDADVALDLQKLIEQCYENGAYDDDIDYRAEADPPLEPNEARWADELLRKSGKRTNGSRSKRGRRRNGKR
jgi:hypothetical protein